MSGDTSLDPDNKERMWALWCHLSALVILVPFLPLGNIGLPLILWLLKKKGRPFVDAAGKESINFQLSMTLYVIIALLLLFVFFGLLFIFVILVFNMLLVVYASIKTSQGEYFRYPATIRFIK